MANGLLNPWTMLGAGLLQAGGPHFDPGKATLGAGLGAGLNNLLGFEQFRAQQRAEQDRRNLARARIQALQSEQQQALRQQAQQQEAIQGLLATVPESQRAQMASLLQLDPKAAIGLLTAQPDEQWSEPYIDNSTGKPILVQRNNRTGQLRSIGTGGTTINVGTGPAGLGVRPVTRAEAEQFGLPTTEGYVVEDGKIKQITGTGQTDTSRKRSADAALAFNSLDRINNLVTPDPNNPSAEVVDPSSAWLYRKSQIASSPAIRGLIPDELEPSLNAREAALIAELGQFQKGYIAMLRGAQVGPAEEASFMEVLPQIGENRETFMAKLKTAKKNMVILQEIINSRLSAEGSAPPPPPPGFVPIPE